MPYPSALSPNPTQASSATPSVPVTSPNPAPDYTVTGFLSIALTLSLVLMLLSYKKYRTVQRSRLLKRQVAMLEAMWRMSSTKRKF